MTRLPGHVTKAAKTLGNDDVQRKVDEQFRVGETRPLPG